MPLPATRVVPGGWERHHRPVSADVMPATCRVDRPSTAATWDDTAGRSVYPAPQRIYPADGAAAGPCRVGRGSGRPGGSPITVGDRDVTVSPYMVTIPTCTPEALVGDMVTMVCCPGDPDLEGKRLKVVDVARGSLTWERVLACTLQPPVAR